MQLIRGRNKNKSQRAGSQKAKKLLNDFRQKKPRRYHKQEALLPTESKERHNFLCIGDLICLYCEDTQGYVYNCQSSTVHNGLQIYHKQNMEQPRGIPDPRAVVFCVSVPHRYKLTKKYRRLTESTPEPDVEEERELLEHVKAASIAENTDNVMEQKRNTGRRVRYGEVIQLKHSFTGKFIHMSTTKTSKVDKNNMMVTLEPYSAKHAQFRILPRYKVRTEGEAVQILDQIVLESVKYPGNYLHASEPELVKPSVVESELNLGIDKTSFTVVQYYRPEDKHSNLILCGSCIRLFHKHLEAYLVAEGLHEEKLTETVHLRLREVDPMVPRTMRPSTSGTTYWQIEDEHTIIYGGPLYWGQQVRFRHMTTRHYLCLGKGSKWGLTSDAYNPRAVFRLHPLLKVSDEITEDSYARIEHVLTGCWLHGERSEIYTRQSGTYVDNSDLSTLPWDRAQLRQVTPSKDRMYHDAYTLQVVEQPHSENFVYVAGMTPFLLDLISQRVNSEPMNAKKSSEIQTALAELNCFVKKSADQRKIRQKLLRNLRIVDLVTTLFKLPILDERDESHMLDIHRACYDLLLTYLTACSKKNALYFAKYFNFFQSQIKGTLGLEVVDTLIILLKDNREIIERISHTQIDCFLDLLKERHYKYLDLLGVLCVCKDDSLPDNQTYITNKWLKGNKVGLFLTERGQNISRTGNVVYLSVDLGNTWIPLHEFVDPTLEGYCEKDVLYLEHQLDLFQKLCFGRNQDTIHILTLELKLLTWEKVSLCLQNDLMPDAIRANYCQLVNELFINVGSNYSIYAHQHSCIVYDELDIKDPSRELDFMRTQFHTELDAIFPVLNDWVRETLGNNCILVARNIGRNKLIQQVLQMMLYFVSFGYYNSLEAMTKLSSILIDMLDGKTDRPFVPEKSKKRGIPKDVQKKFQYYTKQERFMENDQNDLISAIKIRVLHILDYILIFQERITFRALGALYKQTVEGSCPERQATVLRQLFSLEYESFAKNASCSSKHRKVVLHCLKQLFESTVILDGPRLSNILMDLLKYQGNMLARKALDSLDKYYSLRSRVFQRSVNALILTSVDSVRVHRQLAYHLPRLKRYLVRIPTAEESLVMAEAVSALIELFDNRCKADSYEMMIQKIMLNHGVLQFIFDVMKKTSSHLSNNTFDVVSRRVSTLFRLLCNNNHAIHSDVFTHLDVLIGAQADQEEIIRGLTKVFQNNSALCVRIQPNLLENLVKLAFQCAGAVPGYGILLSVLVKPFSHGEPLKRNQTYVIKYVVQYFNQATFPLDKTRSVSEQLVVDDDNEDHVKYVVNMMDLLAVCAEGENFYIESICQSVLTVDDILLVMADPIIHLSAKRPFIKFFHNVYFKSSVGLWDSGIVELFRSSCIQGLLELVSDEIHNISDDIHNNKLSRADIDDGLRYDRLVHFNDTDQESRKSILFFLFDTFLPLLETLFSSYHLAESDLNTDLSCTTSHLLYELLNFGDVMRPYLVDGYYLRELALMLIAATEVHEQHQQAVQMFLYDVTDQLIASSEPRNNEVSEISDDEIDKNISFTSLARHCRDIYHGDNTVAVQLNYRDKLVRDKVYSPDGVLECLPLGQEFQHHTQCFINASADTVMLQYKGAETIIKHLGCSFDGNEAVDVKGLKILRCMIYNDIVKLPDRWNEEPLKYTRQIERVRDIQRALVDMGVIPKVMSLFGSRSNQIIDEALSFLCLLLFDANVYIQEAIMKYFKSTKEEVFFGAIRRRLQTATASIRERRAVMSQKRRAKPSARKTEGSAKLSYNQHILNIIHKPLQVIGDKKTSTDPDSAVDYGTTDQDQIQLVLRILAMLCDGQNTDLQNYLRDQPDNPKSFDVVTDVTALIGSVYSCIDRSNIDLVIQTYDTLIEFTSGNQANRMALISNKLIDTINYILRTKSFKDCSQDKIEELYLSIGNLLYLLIEENGPEELEVGKEVKDTIDKEALVEILTDCYSPVETNQVTSPSTSSSKVMLSSPSPSPTDCNESRMELGFIYYLVFIRLCDIDNTLMTRVKLSTHNQRALQFYKDNCLSIEIVKDSNLQKINFRVPNKKILREEIKEIVKWNVKRTSASERIRDFIAWSRDILSDVRHQRKILSNRLAAFLTRNWLVWNQSVILISLVINSLMLLTWQAPMALEDVPSNTTDLPRDLYNPNPVISHSRYYRPVVLTLAILHNLMAFVVLVTYFIANHPKMPDLLKPFRKLCRRGKLRSSKPVHKSRLEVHLLSTGTIYYLLFFSLSLAGTLWSAYMLAFHLLHIVNINQLLRGVIKAVTKNGKSLLWVAVLALIIFYLYSLVSFAFLRNMFDPEDELFCATLWQCTVTVIRYGMIGDYREKFHTHPLLSEFTYFTYLSIYQVSFFVFISTIGLNVIFGIIVDTFSEHRELKWAAEADMRDSCFICARPSYEFERLQQGFSNHVKNEHNMWAYIFFFIHLEDTKPNDYTCLDLYVAKKLREDDYDFFPLNQAMCLMVDEDDDSETKIDQLLNGLIILVKRQREMESSKKQEDMKQKQEKWQQIHRHRIRSSTSYPADGTTVGKYS